MEIRRYFKSGSVYYEGTPEDNALVDYYNEGHTLVECAAKFTDFKVARATWTLLQASEVRFVRNYSVNYPIIYKTIFESIYGVKDRQYEIP